MSEAFIAPWVSMGSGCLVHPFAYVGRLPSRSPSLARSTVQMEWLEIGDGSEIGVGAIIFGGVSIGARCMIGDQAYIREGVVIGDACVIGQGVSIGFNAQLGANVRVMQGAYISHDCAIGSGTLIGIGVTMAGDRSRDAVRYHFDGSDPPIIGSDCLIGSGACLLPGVRIGDGAVVSMGAVVTSDVPAGGLAMGRSAMVRGPDGPVGPTYQREQIQTEPTANQWCPK